MKKNGLNIVLLIFLPLVRLLVPLGRLLLLVSLGQEGLEATCTACACSNSPLLLLLLLLVLLQSGLSAGHQVLK